MIRLTPIKEHNAGAFALNVKVREDQQHLGNFDFAERLAFAYVEWATTGIQPLVYGIAHGESTPVGVLIINYETAEEGDYINNDLAYYNVWVMWIDKNHQSKGYGKAALEEAIKVLQTKPLGETSCIYIDYKPENESARKTYASVGFVETGEIDGGNIVARLAI